MKDNNETGLREITREKVGWIRVAQYREKWRAFVMKVMELWAS